jgi:hypothetical protein
MSGVFRIISVAGAHSGVGKTTLCSLLLRELRDYGAIKFTKEAFGTPLIDSEEIILQKGKDTAIMVSSGAKKVILIGGQGETLRDALERAIGMMRPFRGVIIEGNGPIEFLRPDLLIFVIGPDRKIKAPAMGILERADIVVVNSEGGERDTSLMDRLRTGARIFFVDLKNKGQETEALLSCIKEAIV